MKKSKEYQSKGDIPTQVSEPAILYAVRQNTIDSAYLGDLKHISGLTDELLSNALNLNVKTFRSYKTTAVAIRPYLQEHIVALLALYNHGLVVFGVQESFNDWLRKDNDDFDNDSPLNLLTTMSGVKYVDDRLTAIEYGNNV